jgi:PKD repeat protein
MKNKLFILGGISLLLTSVFIPSTNLIQAQRSSITWECPLFCNVSTTMSDYVVFGEATDAHDGPPPDAYDVVKPPTPMIPYIRVYLTDSLPTPYNYLWKDYRQYPDSYKVWNLSIQWAPEDSQSPAQVTLSWNPSLLHASEYNSVNLCTNIETPLKNMLIDNSYSFSCPANILQSYKIVCQGANNPPNPPGIPTGVSIGYHGTSYTYSVSTNDPESDSLYYQFNWDDNTTSSWLGPYQNTVQCQASHSWASPGTYQIRARAKDSYGHESNWSADLSVEMMNRAPLVPSSPYPQNGATQVIRNLTIHWTCSDPDNDIVTYDVFFGTNSTPPQVVSHQSSRSFNQGILSNQTTYYWKIVAWDLYGLNATSSLWSFTTGTAIVNPPGGPGGGSNPENNPPTANGSLSDHEGYPGVALLFDGSQSRDSDGYIASWLWNFGDGTTGNGEKTTHAYHTIGSYTVTLTVTDDDGATDTDTMTVVIMTANRPPSQPMIQGLNRGTRNTAYTYMIQSMDLDNDFLRYRVVWGDGTENLSGFLPNGTAYSVTHRWSQPGKYRMTATATDNITQSESADSIIFIDAHFVGTLGYLLDMNNDSIYDVFILNATGASMPVQHLTNGSYLLNGNANGTIQYLYNPMTGALSMVSTTASTEENPWPFVAVIVAAIIVIGAIVYFYKKKYF